MRPELKMRTSCRSFKLFFQVGNSSAITIIALEGEHGGFGIQRYTILQSSTQLTRLLTGLSPPVGNKFCLCLLFIAITLNQAGVESGISYWNLGLRAPQSSFVILIWFFTKMRNWVDNIREYRKCNITRIWYRCLICVIWNGRGAYYTWSNSKLGNDRIWCKLDRILVNQEWIHIFTNPEAIFA